MHLIILYLRQQFNFLSVLHSIKYLFNFCLINDIYLNYLNALKNYFIERYCTTKCNIDEILNLFSIDQCMRTRVIYNKEDELRDQCSNPTEGSDTKLQKIKILKGDKK